jgi:hypothetical protein
MRSSKEALFDEPIVRRVTSDHALAIGICGCATLASAQPLGGN